MMKPLNRIIAAMAVRSARRMFVILDSRGSPKWLGSRSKYCGIVNKGSVITGYLPLNCMRAGSSRTPGAFDYNVQSQSFAEG